MESYGIDVITPAVILIPAVPGLKGVSAPSTEASDSLFVCPECPEIPDLIDAAAVLPPLGANRLPSCMDATSAGLSFLRPKNDRAADDCLDFPSSLEGILWWLLSLLARRWAQQYSTPFRSQYSSVALRCVILVLLLSLCRRPARINSFVRSWDGYNVATANRGLRSGSEIAQQGHFDATSEDRMSRTMKQVVVGGCFRHVAALV